MLYLERLIYLQIAQLWHIRHFLLDEEIHIYSMKICIIIVSLCVLTKLSRALGRLQPKITRSAKCIKRAIQIFWNRQLQQLSRLPRIVQIFCSHI